MPYLKILIFIILAVFILDISYTIYSFITGVKLSETTFNESITIENDKVEKDILFAGDSIAAGVGATSLNNSVSGRFANYYSENYSIYLKNSAVVGNKMEDLVHINKSYDLIVLIISSNDLFRFTPKNEFLKSTRNVLENYSANSNNLVIIGPGRIFETNAIPIFMKPIYKYRSSVYSKILNNESSKYSNVTYINPHNNLDLPKYGDTSAKDNFHPNDEGHKYWFDMVKLGLRE